MSQHALRGRIQNEGLRKGSGVSNIQEKINENRRWIGHVQRWGTSARREDGKLVLRKLKKRAMKIEI